MKALILTILLIMSGVLFAQTSRFGKTLTAGDSVGTYITTGEPKQIVLYALADTSAVKIDSIRVLRRIIFGTDTSYIRMGIKRLYGNYDDTLLTSYLYGREYLIFDPRPGYVSSTGRKDAIVIEMYNAYLAGRNWKYILDIEY